MSDENPSPDPLAPDPLASDPLAPDPLPTRIKPERHPVDLPVPPMPEGALRWTGTVIAVATLFLALTNATAIHGWAAELPPSAIAARLTDASAGWEAFTDRIGLGTPRAALHGTWTKAQAARFGSQVAAGAAH